MNGKQVEATHVASDADGLQWFECAAHEPTDNVGQMRRVSLVPIANWFNENGIPWGDVADLDGEPVPPTERNTVPLDRE